MGPRNTSGVTAGVYDAAFTESSDATLALNVRSALPESSVTEAIDSFFGPVTDAVSSVIFYTVTIGGVTFPLIVGWLVLAATFFTLAFRGPQVWGIRHAVELVRGIGSLEVDGHTPRG